MTKALQEPHRGTDMEGIEQWEEIILGKRLGEARRQVEKNGQRKAESNLCQSIARPYPCPVGVLSFSKPRQGSWRLSRKP